MGGMGNIRRGINRPSKMIFLRFRLCSFGRVRWISVSTVDRLIHRGHRRDFGGHPGYWRSHARFPQLPLPMMARRSGPVFQISVEGVGIGLEIIYVLRQCSRLTDSKFTRPITKISKSSSNAHAVACDWEENPKIDGWQAGASEPASFVGSLVRSLCVFCPNTS